MAFLKIVFNFGLGHFFFCSPLGYIGVNERVIGFKGILEIMNHAIVCPVFWFSCVDQKPIMIDNFVFHSDNIVLRDQPINLTCLDVYFFGTVLINFNHWVFAREKRWFFDFFYTCDDQSFKCLLWTFFEKISHHCSKLPNEHNVIVYCYSS